ncbi:S8 family peptidase [Cellulosimicrobium cellulans]|uniref:S8 family peptidase n=1 Tax=Cellulosimicrobium cellulans TaxID=1710 RepID=UPI00130E7C94|nr:S8 family serine peptidase [Cellulosimicrobium cellulans]
MPRPTARLGRSLAAACALAAAAAASPAAAVAAVPGSDDGRWYYEATGLAEIHQRTTGEGVTVAVLDGRVNTAAPDLAGADVQPHEPAYCAPEVGGEPYAATTTDPDGRHATSMATMIAGTDAGTGGAEGIPGVAPGVTLRTYAIIVDGACQTPADQDWSQDDAMRDALAEGADIIAVPGSNNITSAAVADALRAGAIVIGAGGNDGAISGMPAVANGVVTTGTVTSDATLAEGSPVGSKLSVVAPGAGIRALSGTWDAYQTTTGSSNATAYTAGVLALLWSLHPEASAGQLLQALVHTTDGEVRDTPAHDWEWGYGTVSVRTLLSVDPTSYPDENPFLLDDGREPLVSDVLGTSGDAPTAGPEDDASAPPVTDDSAAATDDTTDASPGFPVVPVVAGVIALVVVGGIVIAVVLGRRRHPRSGTDPHDTPTNYSGGHHG